MAASKTEFLNMRVKPQTKRALRMIAERESRSMANAFEWLVADYLARNRIEVPKSRRTQTRTPASEGKKP